MPAEYHADYLDQVMVQDACGRRVVAQFNLTSKVFDSCFKSSDSTPVGVSVNNDSGPPVVTITSPPPDFFFPGTPTLPVQATASDDTGVTQVEFRADDDEVYGDGPPNLKLLDLQTDPAAPYSAVLSLANPSDCFIWHSPDEAPSVTIDWTNELDAAGASGRMTLNGDTVVFSGPGPWRTGSRASSFRARAGPGRGGSSSAAPKASSPGACASWRARWR